MSHLQHPHLVPAWATASARTPSTPAGLARSTLSLAALALAAATAQAQTAPDAGSLLRQATPAPQPPKPEAAKPLVDHSAPAPAAATEGGPQVQVQGFALEGNETLSGDVLQAELTPWIGKPASLATLREAAAAVCAAYARAGWLAQCDLPPQDITEGKIRIRVLEARFGGVRVQGELHRFKSERAVAMVTQALKPGDKLSLTRLDRAVLLVDAVPGVNASGTLSPGSREGEADLTLGLADTPLFSADLGLDNGGQRSTGSARASALARLDSPIGLGDSWSAQLLKSRGNDYLRLGASLPVGLSGWRVGLNASALRYKIIAGEMASLDARGTGGSTGLEASYPLVRSQTAALQLQLSADSKRFNNEANGAKTSHYRVRNLNIGLYGSLLDSHQGSNTGNLTLTSGKLNLDGSPSQTADAAPEGPHTAGGFTKLLFGLGRQQAFNGWLSGRVNLSGQMASKNLDTSERFYLGGPSGVRAYPSSEGGGSSGQMLNLELRAQLPKQFSLTGFYDHGRVKTLVDGAFPGPGPNAFSLKGAGASLAWNGPKGLNLQLTVARRIGSNPNPSHTGTDQDGTLKRNRVWLQASLPI